MVLLVALVALIGVIVAIVLPIITHESAGESGQETPDGYTAVVSATGDDGRTRTLEAFDANGEPATLDALRPGDVLHIRGSGYDSSIGIYVAFCKIPADSSDRPSPCLGGVPDDATEEKDPDIATQALESAWVTDNWAWRAFASHRFTDPDAGTFEVILRVPAPATDELDCRTEPCGVFTRADHTALSDRVQDLYLPVAFR